MPCGRQSTVILFAEGTSLPFDIALLRGIPYRLDASGNPANPEGDKQNIVQRLQAANQEPHDDSPLFTLIQDMPRIEVDHEKTDLFRDRVSLLARIQEAADGGAQGGSGCGGKALPRNSPTCSMSKPASWWICFFRFAP